MSPLDEERLPVIVATGQCIERSVPVAAVDLLTRAAAQALDEAPGLRARIGRVSVVNILSPAPAAPATVLARRLGLTAAAAEASTIGGNSPQSLLRRAAAAIAAGEAEAVLVAGAEAQRSTRAMAGTEAASAEELALPADRVVGDARHGIGPAELAAGMVAPVHVYAMFESVLAARAGRDFTEHRAALGELMAPFTVVAAAHPVAWFPERRSAADLAEPSPDNRLVAEPYPKRMCAVMGVDQGAAVLVSSLAAARRAGVADGAVFCLAAAEANDVWFPTERADPGSSPAMAAAASAALEAAGLGIDEVGAFDLYSCFPCVVQMAAAALGLAPGDSRGLTVTGGLPYFGGPGNDYTLHAIATMAGRLRHTGGVGLVSGLGWYATKHAIGLYGAEPPRRGWLLGDTAAAQAAIDATAVPVAPGEEAGGAAVVVAATVVAGRGPEPVAAPVIARLPDGRQVAAAADGGELAELAGRNLVGTTVELEPGSPPRYRPTG